MDITRVCYPLARAPCVKMYHVMKMDETHIFSSHKIFRISLWVYHFTCINDHESYTNRKADESRSESQPEICSPFRSSHVFHGSLASVNILLCCFYANRGIGGDGSKITPIIWQKIQNLQYDLTILRNVCEALIL